MTGEQWALLKKLFIACERLRIDNVLMSGMLAKSMAFQTPPEDWLGELKQLRQLPAHRDALQELEQLLAAIDQDRSDSEINRLLESLPLSNLVN